MTTLHIFSKPLNYYASEQLRHLITEQDQILLVGDACYDSTQFSQYTAQLLLLEEDLIARAIECSNKDKPISYTDFVNLCLACQHTISW